MTASTESKYAAIEAIVNGETVPNEPPESIGPPSSGPVPFVTLDYATQQAKNKINRDRAPIAMPEGFVYIRTMEVYDLTDQQIVNNLKNTRENARLKYGRVFNYVPDQNGQFQEGKAYPTIVGLVARNDAEMRAEVDALIAKLEQEGTGPTRDDFDP